MKGLKKKYKSEYLYIIKKHIENNIKEYLLISLIFLIGIVLGVIFFNNTSNNNGEISKSINDFVIALKTDYQIDFNLLLKKTIFSNSLLVIGIWLISMITIIGVPIVCTIILLRGFVLGYTISIGITTFGLWKGILFNLSSLLFQNIIYIPCLIALGVSSIKLYKSIVNNKKKENIKLQIIKHTIFSLIIGLVLILSSILEVYVSGNLISIIVKYL